MPTAPSEDSVEDLARHLIATAHTFGITRVADLTGLDRLGIPVAQAVRPEALSNAVSQGKGRTLAEAAVSAILEAAETCFAERIEDLDAFVATADSLGNLASDFSPFLRPDAGTDWRERSTRWVFGEDLASGARQAVPLELVHTCYVAPPLDSDGLFLGSTTGLAVAPRRDAAIAHGLLEIIERDAIARAQRTHGFFHDARIDPATIADKGVKALLARIAAAGMLVGLWAADGAGGIPVIWCQLLESGAAPPILPYSADGFAVHPDPAVAIRKALVEAAQSRLAAISGARDDMTRAAYPARPDQRAIQAMRRLLSEGPRPLTYDALVKGSGIEHASLTQLAITLASAGKDRIIVVDTGRNAVAGVHGVRVVVPGLEPLHD